MSNFRFDIESIYRSITRQFIMHSLKQQRYNGVGVSLALPLRTCRAFSTIRRTAKCGLFEDSVTCHHSFSGWNWKLASRNGKTIYRITQLKCIWFNSEKSTWIIANCSTLIGIIDLFIYFTVVDSSGLNIVSICTHNKLFNA